MRRNGRREVRMWQQVSKEQREAARRVEQLSSTLAADSHVQPGVSRTGHVTLRCELCNSKVCYRDRKSAEAAVARIPDPMIAYLADCGWWHLATERVATRTNLAGSARVPESANDSTTRRKPEMANPREQDPFADPPRPPTPPTPQGPPVTTQDEPAPAPAPPTPGGVGVGSGNKQG